MNNRSMLLRVLIPSVFVLALGADECTAAFRGGDPTASVDTPAKVQTNPLNATSATKPGV